MKKFVEFIIILLVVLITIISVLLYVQPKMFFFPWHDRDSYSKLLTNNNFTEIKIDNDGNLISGWIYHNVPNTSAPLLIFFGGNAQNTSNTCINFLNTNTYRYFEGYNIMFIDYPGYGLSEGKTSDKTMFDTALKSYDYATTLDFVDKNNIIVLGYSIGTGVATYVASQRNVNGLILIAPYDEALSLYNNTLNIFHGPLKVLARYKFSSLSYAPNVNVYPLIITSEDDEVINYKLSINLSNYFKIVEKVVLLENVGHNYYFSQQSVLENIYHYLQKRL